MSPTTELVIPGAAALAGVAFLVAAVVHERLMHRHRKPGVSYRAATFRLDGGWRREELFNAEGLRMQRRASLCGVTGAVLLLASLLLLVVLGSR